MDALDSEWINKGKEQTTCVWDSIRLKTNLLVWDDIRQRPIYLCDTNLQTNIIPCTFLKKFLPVCIGKIKMSTNSL